jgi:hypothetical protein
MFSEEKRGEGLVRMATNSFLSTKYFHPGKKANRTKVFEAEQKHIREEAALKERQLALRREKEHVQW